MKNKKGIILIKDWNLLQNVMDCFPDWIVLVTDQLSEEIKFFRSPENTVYETTVK